MTVRYETTRKGAIIACTAADGNIRVYTYRVRRKALERLVELYEQGATIEG